MSEAAVVDLSEELADIPDVLVERDVSLKDFTTWRVGGPAAFLVRVSSIDGLVRVRESALSVNTNILVLGRGSNVLVSDSGYDGIVVLLTGGFEAVEVSGTDIRAGAGASLRSISEAAAGQALSGLEFAHWIPGTAGGAVMTNAGAHSSSTCSVLCKVTALDQSGREVKYASFEDRYRTALVPEGMIVTSVRFEMERAPRGEIEARIREYGEHRRDTQPVGVPSAGSVFKNPEGDSAWRLIEACGMKGARAGGAKVSEKHANFILNDSGASASEIKLLIDRVTDEVMKRFDIALQTEVRLVGFEKE